MMLSFLQILNLLKFVSYVLANPFSKARYKGLADIKFSGCVFYMNKKDKVYFFYYKITKHSHITNILNISSKRLHCYWHYNPPKNTYTRWQKNGGRRRWIYFRLCMVTWICLPVFYKRFLRLSFLWLNKNKNFVEMIGIQIRETVQRSSFSC